MIIERLTLNNFGLYRGEQVLDLTPSPHNGKSVPIILFGGINGGGKTTILDAVKLALYGSRGSYSKRSNTAYDEFLRDSVNRGVPLSTGASVTLTFRITLDGEEHSYEVRRAWYQRGRTLRERAFVSKDGLPDQYLAEHWIDLVEEVIPLGVSQLFFFDAEQIRFLADDDTAQASLGTAIKSLLGLDLAEKLIADASVLESRFTEQTAGVMDNPELAQFQAALDVKEKELERTKADRASLENHRQRAENAWRKAEDKFAAIGGKHWQERDARRQALLEFKNRLDAAVLQLIQLAAGALPLCLVPDLLDQVSTQDAMEKELNEQAIVHSVLADRDAQVLDALKREGVPRDTIVLVRKVLEADRRLRRKKIDISRRVALSELARSQLQGLRENQGDHLRHEASDLLRQFTETTRNVEAAEHSLAAIPDDSDVAEHVRRLQDATKELAVLNDRTKRLDADIAALQSQRDALNQKLLAGRRESVERELATEQAARMVKLSIRTQDTMRAFLCAPLLQK